MSQLSLSSPWEVQSSEALQIVDVTEHHTFVFPFSSNLTHCAFAEVQKFAQQQLVPGARAKACEETKKKPQPTPFHGCRT